MASHTALMDLLKRGAPMLRLSVGHVTALPVVTVPNGKNRVTCKVGFDGFLLSPGAVGSLPTPGSPPRKFCPKWLFSFDFCVF